MKTDLVVAAFIIDKDKVLLIHHSKLNIWLPVGGHIIKDETPDEAVHREILEEVGINVKILNESNIPLEGNVKKSLATPIYVNVHSVGDHDHCCFYYAAKAINPKEIKINHEVKNFDWFTKKDLEQKHVPLDVKNIALKAFLVYEKEN